MINLNNLAKYSLNQIDGQLKQAKKRYQIFRIWTFTFLAFTLAFMVVAIVSLTLYILHARGNYLMFYLTISSSVIFGIFLVLFLIFLALNIKQNLKSIKILDTYLKAKKYK